MSVNISSIVLKKKMYDFGWFFATRIRFIEADPDPDPADQKINGSKRIRIRNTA